MVCERSCESKRFAVVVFRECCHGFCDCYDSLIGHASLLEEKSSLVLDFISSVVCESRSCESQCFVIVVFLVCCHGSCDWCHCLIVHTSLLEGESSMERDFSLLSAKLGLVRVDISLLCFFSSVLVINVIV